MSLTNRQQSFSKAEKDRLLSLAARKSAARSWPEEAGGSYIYYVKGGWETRVLSTDSDVFNVCDKQELFRALEDKSCDAVFVPGGADIKGDLKQLCAAKNASKTIFCEVQDDE